MTTPAARTKRLCDVCGQLDTDPRHVQSVGPDNLDTVPTDEFLRGLPDGVPAVAIAEILDPSTLVRHMDCCASAGCSLCQDVLADSGNASGAKLLKHLTKED